MARNPSPGEGQTTAASAEVARPDSVETVTEKTIFGRHLTTAVLVLRGNRRKKRAGFGLVVETYETFTERWAPATYLQSGRSISHW